MARGANTVRISVIDREWGVLRVIESRLQPVGRVVTGLASGGEELRLCCMSRVRGCVVIGLVAPYAISRQRGVVVVDVAVGAEPWRRGMHSGQGERRVV